MTKGSSAEIKLSPRAFLYFLGYFAWKVFAKFILWLFIGTAAAISISLIRSNKIYGMSDKELGLAFISPLPFVFGAFILVILIYAVGRSLIATYKTHYSLTPRGVMLESGWLTRTTTLITFEQIQKMTVISNPYDRIFKSAYIHLDLMGGGNGVDLEAVDHSVVADLRDILSQPDERPMLSGTKAMQDSHSSQKKSPAHNALADETSSVTSDENASKEKSKESLPMMKKRSKTKRKHKKKSKKK
ncbi:MAG: PH domain-containing protein [bacterium]